MAPMMRQMQVDKVVRAFLFITIFVLFERKEHCHKNLLLQQRYRRDRFSSHDRDISVERPDLDDDKTMMNFHKEQRKRESRDRRMRDHDDREHDLDNSRDLHSQRFPDKKKSVKKTEAYDFAAHDDKDGMKRKISYYALDYYIAWIRGLYLLHFWSLLLF